MYITVYTKADDTIIASTHPKTKKTKYFRMEDVPTDGDSNTYKSVATEITIIDLKDYEVLYETNKSLYKSAI